ncbi:MAG: hypothetical protein ACKPAE_15430, partial [Microcystis panniformis]
MIAAVIPNPVTIKRDIWCVPRSLDLFENTFNDVAMDWETRIALNPNILVGFVSGILYMRALRLGDLSLT